MIKFLKTLAKNPSRDFNPLVNSLLRRHTSNMKQSEADSDSGWFEQISTEPKATYSTRTPFGKRFAEYTIEEKKQFIVEEWKTQLEALQPVPSVLDEGMIQMLAEESESYNHLKKKFL
jgi:hypothetical protein